MKEGINYSKVKHKIKPFDLILFKGISIYSKFIQANSRLITGCGDFSHIGIVITTEVIKLPNMKDGELYIWESTSSGKKHMPKNIEGKSFIGTQVRLLSEVVKEYDKKKNTRIAWARLQEKHRPSKKIVDDNFFYCFMKFNERFYDMNPCNLLGAMYCCCRPCTKPFDKATPNWLFCSELVAIVYRCMQIIPEDVDPKYVIPVDFIGYDIDNMPQVVDSPVYVVRD